MGGFLVFTRFHRPRYVRPMSHDW